MTEKTSHGIDVYDELTDAIGPCDQDELNRLIEEIYPELKQLAHYQLAGERSGHTLSTTAIVNEAYVRMQASRPRWKDQAHFFRVAARVMRHLLVDHARKRQTSKRGHGEEIFNIDDLTTSTADDVVAVLAIDAAMKRIEDIDSRMARVVECRYFAGLSVTETSEILDIPLRTVERDLQRARAYINRELNDEK